MSCEWLLRVRLSRNGSPFGRRALLQTKSLLPGIWLCFSLTFSRGNYRDFLRRSRLLLGAAFVLPVFCAVLFAISDLWRLPFVATPLNGGLDTTD